MTSLRMPVVVQCADVHPSLTCYKHHGCRCFGCRRLNAAASARYRATHPRRRRQANGWADEETGVWITPPRTREEWMALRLLVGLG